MEFPCEGWTFVQCVPFPCVVTFTWHDLSPLKIVQWINVKCYRKSNFVFLSAYVATYYFSNGLNKCAQCTI